VLRTSRLIKISKGGIVKRIGICVVVGLSLIWAPQVFAKLPSQVFIESKTRTFTHEWFVALEDGRLFVKKNRRNSPRRTYVLSKDHSQWVLLDEARPEVPEEFQDEWLLVNKHGRPPLMPSSETIVEITADGDNLIAVADSMRVYYGKFSSIEKPEGRDGRVEMVWKNRFGRPKFFLPFDRKTPFKFELRLDVPEAYKSIAMSHRGPLVGGYECIDNNFHQQSAGVTTLYLLDDNGLDIRFTDPWIPAHWDRLIAGPEDEDSGQRRKLVAMSASASTIFVVTEAGKFFTTLRDFDTIGENPYFWFFKHYTYLRSPNDPKREKGKMGGVRTLPGDSWVAHPKIVNGMITDKITVVQNGKGNASRELRAEGVIMVHGVKRTGYFSKPIILNNPDTNRVYEWIFIETDQKTVGRFLNDRPEELPFGALWAKKRGKDYDFGFLRNKSSKTPFMARLFNFHPQIRKAKIYVTTASGEFEMILHTYKLNDYKPDDKIRGAIMRPSDDDIDENVEAQMLVQEMFRKKTFAWVTLTHDFKNRSIRIKSYWPQRGISKFDFRLSDRQ